MNEYIKQSGYEEKLVVNPLVLGYALVDYFEDIQRLKALHPIEHINSIKIYAYTSYWIINRKPIQILKPEKDLIYANERYVYGYIMDFLNKEYQVTDLDNIYISKRSGINTFRETLFYYLKYRLKDAFSLELMITSFFSGQIYQSADDMSDSLSSKYKDPNAVES